MTLETPLFGIWIHQAEAGSCRFEVACARCSAGCDDIPSGVTVTDKKVPTCVELMEGARASSRGTTIEILDLEEGYYRTSNKSQVVVECLLGEACVGGIDAENYCAAGYKGPCECCCRWTQCFVFFLTALVAVLCFWSHEWSILLCLRHCGRLLSASSHRRLLHIATVQIVRCVQTGMHQARRTRATIAPGQAWNLLRGWQQQYYLCCWWWWAQLFRTLCASWTVKTVIKPEPNALLRGNYRVAGRSS